MKIPAFRARRGPRLLVRSPMAPDERSFTTLAASSRRFHAGWVDPPVTAEEFAAYLRLSQEIHFEALLLVRREDRAILGAVNLSQIVRGGFRSAYLDYWIGAPYARQGYMREGLGLALDYTFRSLLLHRLEANIQPANTASRKLVEGLGFRLEGFSPRYLRIAGRWRDHERWAILREEWRARRLSGTEPHEGRP